MENKPMQRYGIIPSIAVSDTRLSDSEVRTLLSISIHADRDGWCFPSQATLAEIRSISRKTVNEHVSKLTSLGYLNTAKRFREDGGQTSNRMQVKLDIPIGSSDNLPCTNEEQDDVTPPVTPEGYTPCNPLKVTPPVTPEGYTNRPVNRPIEQEIPLSPKQGVPSFDNLIEKPYTELQELCKSLGKDGHLVLVNYWYQLTSSKSPKLERSGQPTTAAKKFKANYATFLKDKTFLDDVFPALRDYALNIVPIKKDWPTLEWFLGTGKNNNGPGWKRVAEKQGWLYRADEGKNGVSLKADVQVAYYTP